MLKKIARIFSISIVVPTLILAQSFKSNIEEATGKLTMIVVLICAASGVWAGIEFAKGNPAAPNRILMSAIGGVVAVIGAQVVKFVVAA